MRFIAFTLVICFAAPLFAETKKSASKPTPATKKSAATTQAPPAGTVTDAQVSRNLQIMQARLEQEEKNLQARIAQLNKMRAAALQKNDLNALKRIEQLEQAAVSSYEQRVSSLIKTPVAKPGASQPKKQPEKKSSTPSRRWRIFGG